MKTNRIKLNQENHLMYRYIKQLGKAITGCNALGLCVTNVEFDRLRKPRIEVEENPVLHRLLEERKAFIYGSQGRKVWVQTNIEGIKVICKNLIH